MKKIVLLVSILLGISIDSYATVKEPIEKPIEKKEDMKVVNRSVIKEMTSFYGGYKEIYADGIDEKNIGFLSNEIRYKDLFVKTYDLKKLKNKDTVEVSLDQGIELTDISYLEKLKVVGKTHKNSKVSFEKENKKLLLSFSGVGEYKIAFTYKNKSTKIVNFKKSEDLTLEEKNITKNLQDSYDDKNVIFLTKNLGVLETFFPDSESLEDGLFYALELNEESKNYEVVRVTSRKLVSKYKLTKEKKDQVIDSYLNALKELGETDEYLSFLGKLSGYEEKYQEEFLEASVEYDFANKKAVDLAKAKLKEEANPEISNYLGNYYYKEANLDTAIYYYQRSNNVEKLAKIYLDNEDEKSLDELKEKANNDDKNKIAKIQRGFEEEKRIEHYIGVAENYTKEGRLQEAELYYEKLLNKKISSTLKSDIHYKLVDVYYKLNELKLAEKNLRQVSTKVLTKKYLGDYYYLGGIVYYDSEDYGMSTRYFEKLVELFPDTTLSNRGRIYMMRIKNINKNKLQKR